MIVRDLFGSRGGVSVGEIQPIKAECSQFLQEAAGFPLLKALPSSYASVHKVKVRLQKRRDQVTDVFERAFGSSFTNLRQRAIFTYPKTPPLLEENTEPFYVFPVNGYQFLYSKEVTNSSRDYQAVFDKLCEQFNDHQAASDIVTELLTYTYTSSSLYEGIVSNSEIILYGIPCYYALRVSACPDYSSLLGMAK